jgi:16S rRNA (guanine966-N2)-methyltransferase
MRIIAGQRRGHKFEGPPGRGMRPTSDLVRESIFNILGDVVEGRLVVDLFAGTGGLGLEALSRGAARAIFVEQHREHAALIRRNLATLRFEDRAVVHNADAFRWARGFEPGDAGPVVVFLDPPYREYENHPGRVRRLLDDLRARLPAGSILVVESGKAHEADILPDPDAWDLRRYGGTRIALRTIGPDGATAPPESSI